MKAGLVTSVTLHVALIGFGLFSLSAPRAYEVADVESLPVDIVPVEALSQVQEGKKDAPLAERPAPTPTRRPESVENAQKVGDADTDLDAPPTPEPRQRPVEQAAEPPPAPRPEPKPANDPAPEPSPAPPEQTQVAATEREPERQPPQEVKPDPASEPLVAESAKDESVALPQTAPVPEARPQPPKPQTAKAPEQKKAEEPAKQQQTAKNEKKEEELLDQVAALLNKEKASGGGAKRSEEQAALGGQRTTGGEKLTQSEMDALRGQIQQCWNVPAGALDAENLKVSIKFKLDPSGMVEGNPEIVAGGSGSTVERAAALSAQRAILKCAPYNLPAEKYDTWADVLVHFDPRDMF